MLKGNTNKTKKIVDEISYKRIKSSYKTKYLTEEFELATKIRKRDIRVRARLYEAENNKVAVPGNLRMEGRINKEDF